LAALSAQDYAGAWEVVVADNGSSDGSAEIAREWEDRLPHLQVVDASGRRGSAYARNVGTAASSGDFLAFCDSDDLADPSWITGLASAARSSDMVGGALDFRRLSDENAIAWRGVGDAVLTPGKVEHFLPIGVGANCGIWRAVLEQVGGWNEEYPRQGDDVELSWRVQLASFHLGFAPGALVHYQLRDSLRALAVQSFEEGKSHAQLYRDFRDQGMTRRPLRLVLRSWAGLACRLPYLGQSRARRGWWIRRLSLCTGQFVGTMCYRRLYL